VGTITQHGDYVRTEISECIYDSFRPGEAFTTKEAVDVCREECESLEEYSQAEVFIVVLEVLNWQVRLGLLQKAPTGWRL